MIAWLPRIIQKLRTSRKVSVATLAGLLLMAIFGNATTFYIFDGASNPDITYWDSIWYSIISVTTIGYGDISSSSVGARIGTIFFIVILGLSAFSAFLGLLVDGMMNLNFREMHGLSKVYCKDHILLIHFPDSIRVEKIIRELREDPQYKDTEIVLVNDKIDMLPFDISGVAFVKGSPLQLETLERANLRDAKVAIILCTSQEDSGSDGKVASVLTIVEHIHPDIKTIAECMDKRHEILFRSTNCDSVVYSNQIVNNLLVQEAQDSGVSSLITTLTDNGQGFTLYSTEVTSQSETTYRDLSKQLSGMGTRLVSVERQDVQILDWDDLKTQLGDRIIYIGRQRESWEYLRTR